MGMPPAAQVLRRLASSSHAMTTALPAISERAAL